MSPKSASRSVPNLSNHAILLSASFPSGERFRPYEPGSISDAVVAIARGVLAADGRLVFGGHPTITPIVLLIASELGITRRVVVYQSELFLNQITPEVRALEQRGFGTIRWVKARAEAPAEGREKSLLLLRRLMLRESEPLGAFFVGGMEGITDEWRLTHEYSRAVLRFPIGRPGGAARRLAEGARDSGPLAARMAESELYPVLVHDALMLLTERAKKSD